MQMSSRHHNFFEDGAVCFWTSSIIEKIPVLRSPTAAKCLLDVIDDYRCRYRVRLLAYVVMPEHIHLLLWTEHAETVEKFLEQILRHTSARLAAMAGRAEARGGRLASAWLARFRARARGKARVRVWKERGRAHPVKDEAMLLQKMEYIHLNPVKKGYVERAEDWLFSSAAWYTNSTGPITIDWFDV